MEDPWGSPWTADSPPKIDLPLPAPPPNAHISIDRDHSPQRLTPGRSPWDEEEAWAGWNEPGKDSPAWGRSPGLKPLESVLPGQASPDPWGKLAVLETGLRNVEDDGSLPVTGEEKPLDSAVSLGDGLIGMDDGRNQAQPTLTKDEQNDVWTGQDSTPLVMDASSLIAKEAESSPSSDTSPISSADLEARPEPVRKQSKVQELIDRYDEIATRNTSPVGSPVATANVLVANNSSSLSGAGDAFEIDISKSPAVEETQEVPEEEANNKKEYSGPEDDDWSGEYQQQISASEIEAPEALPTEPIPERPKPSISIFAVDTSKLDEMFPSVDTSFPAPEPIPDVIIDDSFASISERKAWYRISRPGSMRMHNRGDAENYVRVNWTDSVVRDRAIRIVRRWMEEDSIAGRVVLGRRSVAGGHMFNWHSSAPPVEISELLGKKGRHSRQVSTTSSNQTTASPVVAAFGWSSSLPASPPVVPIPPVQVQPQSARFPQRPPWHSSSKSFAVSKPSSFSIPPPEPSPTPSQPHETEEEEEEEDDDWGEMVSSPAAGTNGTFPMDSIASSELKVESALSPSLASPPMHGVASTEKTLPVDIKRASGESLGRWEPGDLGAIADNHQDSKAIRSISSPLIGPAPARPSKALTNLPILQAFVPKQPDSTPGAQIPLIPPSPTSDTQPNSGSRTPDTNDAEIVASIIKDLPDLTYMLR